jgi:hypothetical protein
MRGKKAKAIRKVVYGDVAIDTKYETDGNGALRCKGKKQYKNEVIYAR